MEKHKTIFLVWQDGADEQYWNQYESLEDAVGSEHSPVEVFEATPNLLGNFEIKASIVKSKRKGNK